MWLHGPLVVVFYKLSLYSTILCTVCSVCLINMRAWNLIILVKEERKYSHEKISDDIK